MAQIKYPSINLVGYRLGLRALKQKTIKRATTVGLVSLAGFLVIFVATLFIRWSMVNRKQSLTDQLETTTSRIEAMKPIETKYVLLAAKAGGLVEVLTKRVAIEPKILEIYEIIPPGCEIKEVSLGDEAGHLTVSAKAADVFVVGQLLQNITGAVGTRFSQATIASTKRDLEGFYTLSMELIYENKPKS